MSSIDFILAIVAIWGFYNGYSHGIIQTVFNFFSYFFALLIAFKMTPSTTVVLNQAFHTDNPLMFVAGFLVMFVLVMMAFRGIAKLLEGSLHFLHVGVVNQFLGGLVMCFTHILLFSILIWFADKANLIDESTKLNTKSYALLAALPPKAKNVATTISPIIKEFYSSSVSMVDRLERKTEEKQKIYNLPKPSHKESEIELNPDDSKNGN